MQPTLALLALVFLPLACAATGPGGAGSSPTTDALILPEGVTARVQDGRMDLYHAGSRRTGYGYQRSDGSWDIFNVDGTRKATITPGIGGGPARVTVPTGKR